MKKAIILSFILGLGILFFPSKSNAGLHGSCNIDTGYIGGEINGVYYNIAEAFVSKDLTDEEKLSIFKQGCAEEPRACCGEHEEYKFKAPICMMKYFYVDAICSNTESVAEYILASGSLTDKDTILPKTGEKPSDPYENFRLSIAGFTAYIGRTNTLKYMMHKMPVNGGLSRPTMGDKMPADRNYTATIDKTLYDVAINGRKMDDVENPTTKPFITFIQAEKRKWDASHGVADKIKNDLIKSFNGGAHKQISDSKTLALEEQFSGLGAAVGLTGFAELAKHLKSS